MVHTKICNLRNYKFESYTSDIISSTYRLSWRFAHYSIVKITTLRIPTIGDVCMIINIIICNEGLQYNNNTINMYLYDVCIHVITDM